MLSIEAASVTGAIIASVLSAVAVLVHLYLRRDDIARNSVVNRCVFQAITSFSLNLSPCAHINSLSSDHVLIAIAARDRGHLVGNRWPHVHRRVGGSWATTPPSKKPMRGVKCGVRDSGRSGHRVKCCGVTAHSACTHLLGGWKGSAHVVSLRAFPCRLFLIFPCILPFLSMPPTFPHGSCVSLYLPLSS